MTERERLLNLLERARREFGDAAVRRLQRPIRAAAGEEPLAPTGDPLRQPFGIFVPELSARPWHDRDWIPDAALLEAAAPAMRRELDALLAGRGDFKPFDEGADYGFTPDSIQGNWNVYYVVVGGRVAPDAARQCPHTVQALKSLPNFATSAMFSALTPGTHIEPHCGPTNVIVSLSMGLISPPGCVIRVANEERRWHDGVCHVFDDTYEHEVHHRGDFTRFIMLLEAWHPELTAIERKILAPALWSPKDLEDRLGQPNLVDRDWWK